MIVPQFLAHLGAGRTSYPAAALLTLKGAVVVAMPSVCSERIDGMMVIAGIRANPYSR